MHVHSLRVAELSRPWLNSRRSWTLLSAVSMIRQADIDMQGLCQGRSRALHVSSPREQSIVRPSEIRRGAKTENASNMLQAAPRYDGRKLVW